MTRNILVIESAPDLGVIVAEALDGHGGECLVAEDLESADTLIETVRLDWIAVDLGVANGTTAQWLDRLAKTRPELARRTIVVMEPPYQREIAESLESSGASILMKPLRAERLRIELDDLVAAGEAPRPA